MSGKKIVGFLRMIIPLLHFLTLTIEDLRKQKPRSISFHFGHMLMSIQSCDLESGSCPAGRAENLIPETRWKQVNRCNLVSAFIGYFLCCVCSQSCDETERTLDPRPLGNHLIVAISSLIVATVIISIMLSYFMLSCYVVLHRKAADSVSKAPFRSTLAWPHESKWSPSQI